MLLGQILNQQLQEQMEQEEKAESSRTAAVVQIQVRHLTSVGCSVMPAVHQMRVTALCRYRQCSEAVFNVLGWCKRQLIRTPTPSADSFQS